MDSQPNKKPNGVFSSLASLLDRASGGARRAARASLTSCPAHRGGTLFRGARLSTESRARLKRKFAAVCEESFFLSLPGRLSRFMVSVPSKAVAGSASAFSLVALLSLLLKYFLEGAEPGLYSLVLSALPLTVSLPFLFSDRSLSSLAADSYFLRDFLIEKIGVRAGSLADDASGRRAGPTLVAAGAVLGALCYPFGVSPVLAFLLLVFGGVFLSAFPESRFVILLCVSPFLGLFPRPTVLTGYFLFCVLLGFLFKCATGRRTFYSASGSAVFWLLFLTVVLGALSPTRTSVQPALASALMMLGFPLAVNLLRDRRRLSFLASALTLSSLCVSTVGIVQFILGAAPGGWTDTSFFPEITHRATAVFDNPNFCAAWLNCVFPFTLYSLVKNTGRAKRSAVYASVSTAVCTVLTFSRSGWLGMAAGGIILLLFVSLKYLIAIPGIGAAAAVCGLTFKDSVGKRLTGFASLYDSANLYRVRVWQGAARASLSCLFTGTGAGDIAFSSLYALFAYPGTSTAPHSHSIYLQLLISVGIPGLLLFIAFLAVLVRTAVAAYGRPYDPDGTRLLGAAAFAACAAMALTGVFDNVFYNYRTLFTFWALAGAAVSAFVNAGGHLTEEPFSDLIN